NRNTIRQACVGVAIADDRHDMFDTERESRRLDVGLDQSAAVRRRDLVHRVQHAGQSRVNTEDRLTLHDPGTVDAHQRPADDGELSGLLEWYGLKVRRSQCGREGSNLAVADRSSRGAMEDASLGGAQFAS